MNGNNTNHWIATGSNVVPQSSDLEKHGVSEIPAEYNPENDTYLQNLAAREGVSKITEALRIEELMGEITNPNIMLIGYKDIYSVVSHFCNIGIEEIEKASLNSDFIEIKDDKSIEKLEAYLSTTLLEYTKDNVSLLIKTNTETGVSYLTLCSQDSAIKNVLSGNFSHYSRFFNAKYPNGFYKDGQEEE